MDPLSIFPLIAALLLALLVARFIARYILVLPEHSRLSPIDGLRGYLAFFVFIHHSACWYFYLHTGQWGLPPSNLYSQLGSSSVALFFMITAFLFFNKIINADVKPVDWLHLYISRFLRLTPLYFFAVLLLFCIVGCSSDWQLNETVGKLLINASKWLTFTMLGGAELNGTHDSGLILGVVWTLRYEWGFYFSLPVLALIVRRKPPFPYVLLSSLILLTVLALAYMGRTFLFPYIYFLGGIAACLLTRHAPFRDFATRKWASWIIVACLAGLVWNFQTADGLVQIFLLSLIFALIAGGNTLFGLLISKESRTIGEFAYSVYLLHSIILFIAFNFVLGVAKTKELSALNYWLLILCIAPVVLCTCALTFKTIEYPAMQKTKAATAWLRNLFSPHTRRAARKPAQ